jgi:Tat protein secretion system quality control protein TatD with DNase activity
MHHKYDQLLILGEAGLDKAIKRNCSLQQQEQILEVHLQAAQAMQRPLTLVTTFNHLLDCIP